MTVQYKDFLFPYNPSRLEIRCANQLASHFVLGEGQAVQHLGTRGRTVWGEGCFFGPQGEAQMQELWRVFQEQTGGMLYLPGSEPFFAYFANLEFLEEAGPLVYRYSFLFWEDLGETQRAQRERGGVSSL